MDEVQSAAGSVLTAVSNAMPAERKMVDLGDAQRVRESRMAMQVATEREFVSAIEELVGRRVTAFGSATDTERGTVFENFVFEPREDGGGEDGQAGA
jgi:uncharacterized protein YbcI